ncbi:hypothetical protein GGQ15_000189 [Salinibacter ruber]|nr:hypothetical protein [Salinibacter ruber]
MTSNHCVWDFVGHLLYFVFESSLSIFASVSHFGLLQGYYTGSADTQQASVDLGTLSSYWVYPGFRRFIHIRQT